MIKINEVQVAEAMRDDRNLNLFRKKLRRDFRKLMPKKYGILPKDPKVYRISKTLAIEMPSWGSNAYRLELSSLEKQLRNNFICDTEFYDGKTTILVRKWKKKV